MRILFVHNYYQQAGGEDAVVDAEMRLLSAHGHEVRLHSRTNDDITGAKAKVKAALTTAYSAKERRDFSKALQEFKPDVIHVHNFFPRLTPSIYFAAREQGVPVIQTLHNYRLMCVAANFYRDGKVCESCLGRFPWPGIVAGCYRGSRAGSLVVGASMRAHWAAGTWERVVDRFVCLTGFSKSRFVAGGLPADKIVVKPNFVDVVDPAAEGLARDLGALFVGRLAEEKGIRTLVKAWEGCSVPLAIAGDGPLADVVRDAGNRNIAHLGRVAADGVAGLMRRARFLVIPSQWFEGFPMVICEAMARGLPIIASRLGSMAELVEDGATGLHFTAGDPADLRRAVEWAAAHPERMRQMGENAREIASAKYSGKANYKLLLDIYHAAVGARPAGRAVG